MFNRTQGGNPELFRNLLLRIFDRNDPPARDLSHTVPDGMRIYAIGDIHGRVDLLDRLHGMMDADFCEHIPSEVHVIYLGDYIDRGPESAAVLERLATGHKDLVKVTLLRGNHEELLLRFLKDHSVGPGWLELGGLDTLNSYGIDAIATVRKTGYAGLSQKLRETLPAHHLALLEQMQCSTTIGDYFFCHAGVRPGVPLELQRDEDLTWIRTPFLETSRSFGRIVVHGHSPTDEPDFRHNRINIDTRAYVTGRLTCLVLEGNTRRILST